jgi:hypothetical protein
MNVSRRQSLGLLAGATIPPTAVVAVAAVTTSAEERFAYHLAEFQKAAEELDPNIRRWNLVYPEDGETRGISIVSRRWTGEYLGDGIYEYAEPSVTGVRCKYEVRLRPDLFDGERAFDVGNTMERRVLTETALRTFVGRKIGGL